MKKDNLSNIEQSKILDSLKYFIDFAEKLEISFENLSNDYKNLQYTTEGLIEFLPTPTWILEENGELFIKNSKTQEIDINFQTLDLTKNSDLEIEYGDKFFLIKIVKIKDRSIVTATDLTNVKRNERLISMGQMAAHLAHEIRNPIASVSILTSTLFKKVDLNVKPIVLDIKKSIWRVERIVKSTLLFTKGVTINPREFYLDDLIQELNLVTNNYSYSKDIDFIYELPKIKISADFDLFGIVLQNLIVNAIDSIEESENEIGIVKISHKKNKNNHNFYITDSGNDFIDKTILFEAFKSTKTKGHGLGLALSLQIISAHKGKIELLENEKGFLISIKDR